MIRYSLLWGSIFGLALYAWRDWFKALCGVVILMAILERSDMPRAMFGINGLNPWNFLLGVVMLAWLFKRGREGLRWDMPWYLNVLLLIYLIVVLVAFWRMYTDRILLILMGDTTGSIVGTYLINTIKFVIPGLLFFDGARTRSRFHLAVASVLVLYVLIGVQTIRMVGPGSLLDGDALERRARKSLETQLGYHRTDVSMMLAGASWSVALAGGSLLRSGAQRMGMVGLALLLVLAQALTAGRAGYAAWVGVGFFLGAVRWRSAVFGLPVVVALLFYLAPGVKARFFQGIETEDTLLGEAAIDQDEVTAGRANIWPLVADKIKESPWVGFGRQAMVRTELTFEGQEDEEVGERFNHPHNAYLEWLLDNGIFGALLVGPFYVVCMVIAVRLLRDHRSPVFVAAGALSGALLVAHLGSSIGGQTFYPRESSVGMWCAFGLAFRAWVERRRLLGADLPEGPFEPPAPPDPDEDEPAPRWRPRLAPEEGRTAPAGHHRSRVG